MPKRKDTVFILKFNLLFRKPKDVDAFFHVFCILSHVIFVKLFKFKSLWLWAYILNNPARKLYNKLIVLLPLFKKSSIFTTDSYFNQITLPTGSF
jgi:hypothetical protein